MYINKYVKIILLIFSFILIIFSFKRFNGEKIVFYSEICNYPMLWLHAAGSKERLKYAVENKYCGVEIDTTYSTERGLIASYNNPDDKNAQSIDELIKDNFHIRYWWLDLKNLNNTNAREISELINRLSMVHTRNIFFIESHNFIGLWFLKTKLKGIYKVYWLSKGPNKNNQIHWKTPLYYLRSILANMIIDPDFVSMFHYQVGNFDYLWVGNRQRFAFTVNTHNDYQLITDMGVEIILTDDLKITNNKF